MQWNATRYEANEEINGQRVTLTVSECKAGWRGQAIAWYKHGNGGGVIATVTRRTLGLCRGSLEEKVREVLSAV